MISVWKRLRHSKIRNQHLIALLKFRTFLGNLLIFSSESHIMKIIEPDTPLNDADHVGSFNFCG